MNKKILFKYILIFLPFVTGVLLFSFGIVNIFSALLFFVGGYIAMKNSLDYRKIKKNNDVLIRKDNSVNRKEYDLRSSEQIVGFKRNVRYPRVRKRVK